MDDHFLTPSGLTVRIFGEGKWSRAAQGDILIRSLTVASTATTRHVQVELDEFLVPQNVEQITGERYAAPVRDDLAMLAILRAVDEDPSLVGESDEQFTVRIDANQVAPLLKPARLTDREIRRYLARRVYDGATRGTLKTETVLRDLDVWITGPKPADLERNAQMLEEEEYLRESKRVYGEPPRYLATAKLMRDVERFGSARDDAITAIDFKSQLTGIGDPAARDAILLEYDRYVRSTRPDELASVFRAIAPLVERLLRGRLKESGATRDLPTLGPMIAELRKRQLGDLGLIAMLNHVLKFGRDLEQHGTSLPESVLRIACANAFELIPRVVSI